MAQLFPPSANSVAKSSFIGLAVLLCAAGWLAYRIERTTYFTKRGVIRDQPVPFSHKHHVSGLGLDCRYCHVSAEDSSFAGIPSTRTCMTCHSQIWTGAPMLEPVRASAESGEALVWHRVNRLPDYVYFDHSIHVRKGIACQTCHGQVQDMPLTWKGTPFPVHMKDCLACHRRQPGAERVRLLTDCYTCHR